MMEYKKRKKAIDYDISGFLFDCDTKEKIMVEVEKTSPLGMTIITPRDSASILGNEVIIVTSTIVMYADAVSEKQNRNLSKTVVLSSKRFKENVYERKFWEDMESVNYDEFDLTDVEETEE